MPHSKIRRDISLIRNLCLCYLIYIKIAHVPAVFVFHWAQKVNKLGPIGAKRAGTLLTFQGIEVVKHFLSWMVLEVTSSSPPPHESKALAQAHRLFLGACLTVNSHLVWNSFSMATNQWDEWLVHIHGYFKKFTIVVWDLVGRWTFWPEPWVLFLHSIFMWVVWEAVSFKFRLQS